MVNDWLQLAACALAIAVAGSRMTLLADAIADLTGWSGSWVGLMLLAAATSLPELATGISAVTAARAPDIALGDVLGSTVFNLALLVVLDVLHRPATIYSRAASGHVLSAAFGVVLLGLVGAGVLLERERIVPRLGPIGAYTPLLLLMYVMALRSIYRFEQTQARPPEPAAPPRPGSLSLRSAAGQFAICAGIVTFAGTWLPWVGGRLADHMGWSSTFVGTLLVAGTTSLPEVVVTLTALRLRALDMAMAGLLGSNLFDLAIVAVDDVFYTPGPILADVSPMHALTAFTAAMMSGAVIVGLVLRPHRRLLRTLSVVSAALLTMYLLNVFLLYTHHG